MSSVTSTSTSTSTDDAIKIVSLFNYNNLEFEVTLLRVKLDVIEKRYNAAYKILLSMPDESSKTLCDLYLDYKFLRGQFYEFGWGGCPVDLTKAHSCYFECYEIGGDIQAGIRSLVIESTGIIDHAWIEDNIASILKKCKDITEHRSDDGKDAVNKFKKAYTNKFKKTTEKV
jgi:hypothetical protein